MSQVATARLKRIFPSWQNTLLALAAAGLLILAFPDFEWWWTAWFALVPLMWAVEREKASAFAAFLLGWPFGTAFFFGTCWWLTYAPIHYAAVPWPLAYFLIFVVCLISGLFPGVFAAILALLLRRFGRLAFPAAPFVWVFTEFARYWLTGSNWNAIAYSQAFRSWIGTFAGFGGIYLVGFFVVLLGAIALWAIAISKSRIWTGLKSDMLFALAASWKPSTLLESGGFAKRQGELRRGISLLFGLIVFACLAVSFLFSVIRNTYSRSMTLAGLSSVVVALQPNVPMSGLDQSRWQQLRDKQISLAETEINKLRTTNNQLPTTVILPESPMNFAYEDDREFHRFINDFAARNNVSVLFNSSEPDKTNGKYFNSAVMVGPDGKVAAEYDKIFLLPFGEAVPFPFEGLMPAFVGSFSYGSKYDLVPLGDAKAGVMICFESHFGELSRRYVQGGADAIIEMTNDGYLGPTPVLRQHLANAVFRAVETNRPVLRVTNVGITAYITPNGEVLDPLAVYQEGTRVWSVSKSDGSQTFYVKYGDWFAWLCSAVTIALTIFAIGYKGRKHAR